MYTYIYTHTHVSWVVIWLYTYVNIYGGGGSDLVTKSCLTLVTSWTIALQAPLSMGVPRQKYWNVLPCSSPGDLPNLGMEPVSSALQADSLPLSHHGSPCNMYVYIKLYVHILLTSKAISTNSSNGHSCINKQWLFKILPTIIECCKQH